MDRGPEHGPAGRNEEAEVKKEDSELGAEDEGTVDDGFDPEELEQRGQAEVTTRKLRVRSAHRRSKCART